MGVQAELASFIGPSVVCVRGPSRSGKTALCERLVDALAATGLQVAYLKRTHHLLDLPHKASGRVWARTPAAMALRATDRVQLTLPPGDGTADDLLARLPVGIDLVLLETHTPEPYPSLLNAGEPAAEGEVVLARWSLASLDDQVPVLASQVLGTIPADRQLDRALRAAIAFHGGHLCAGLVLGTRLALAGTGALGVTVPDRQKRLTVLVETDRCAVDAIQAVTGCRPGKRTLRLLDHGKLAATFIDDATGRAVRVATRPGLRDQVTVEANEDRHAAQRMAYLAMAPEALFTVREASVAVDQFDRPGPPRRRVDCVRCGEEVSDGRDVATDAGPCCLACVPAISNATQARRVYP